MSYICANEILPAGTFGLYRDDGLAIIEDANSPKVEQLRKKIMKTFKNESLTVTIDTKAKAVDFLDVTLNLTDNSHKPYRKEKNETIYVDLRSNHPPKIKSNIPDMIARRLSHLSSDITKFNNTVGMYQNALKNSGYNHELQFINEAPEEERAKKKRQRRRKVIWFNPPFSNQTSECILKKFLQLLDPHFYPGHPLRKLFNRKTVKVSPSTLPNMGQIISTHNKETLSKATNTAKTERKCNCQRSRRNDCPFNGKCLKSNIVYEATITSLSQTYSYIGLTEGPFKTRFNNRKSSFNNASKRTSTELANKVWELKDHSVPYKISWRIADYGHAASVSSKSCNLCTTEKLLILHNRNRTDLTPLNRMSELVAKCRHVHKHLGIFQKSGSLW